MCVCARTPPLVQRICYRFLCVARHDLDDFTTVTAFEKHREFMVGTRVPRLHLDSPTPPAIRDQVVSASFNRRALGGLAACALSKWHYALLRDTNHGPTDLEILRCICVCEFGFCIPLFWGFDSGLNNIIIRGSVLWSSWHTRQGLTSHLTNCVSNLNCASYMHTTYMRDMPKTHTNCDSYSYTTCPTDTRQKKKTPRSSHVYFSLVIASLGLH
jgi:hypothetical protein